MTYYVKVGMRRLKKKTANSAFGLKMAGTEEKLDSWRKANELRVWVDVFFFFNFK